ncbi:MAG TPA: S9 family peptidase, partial [Thermoanaerobaculia bacterium]|nr:S9 family peptidase [Thermoanaerobaculia bacterium]
MRRTLIALLLVPLAATAALAADEAALQPPSSLLADGMPAVPRALVDEVGRYTEFRSAGFVDWHPVEHQLLIATRFGNTTQIHRVKMPGGDRTQLTFFPEPVTGALYEPHAGKYFLFLKDRGGDEFRQIFRADLADGKVTLLSDGGRSQNGGMVWSHAGDRIAYGSTRRNGADRDLYVMDPSKRESDRKLLEVQGGGWGVEDWSPDDKQLLVSEGISVNESRLWLVDAASGTKTRATPGDQEQVAWGDAKFHTDGKHAYVITDHGEEFAYIGLLDLADKTVKRVSAARSWDVDGFDVTRDGKTIAFVVNEAGLSKLYLLDTATGAEKAVAGVPVG